MIEIDGITYFSSVEFARRHGTTKSYVCRLIRDGKLPAQKVGVQYFIPQAADVAWAERRKRRGTR